MVVKWVNVQLLSRSASPVSSLNSSGSFVVSSLNSSGSFGSPSAKQSKDSQDIGGELVQYLTLLKELPPKRPSPNSGGNAPQVPVAESKSDSAIMQSKPSIPAKNVKSDSLAVLAQARKESAPAILPKPDVASLPQQGLSLRPSLPFSVVTISREDLLKYIQQNQSVKRPLEVESNYVARLVPFQQEVAGEPKRRVKLDVVQYALSETPVGQLVAPDGKQMGYLVPTDTNEVEVPKAIMMRSPTPEGALPQYSMYLPLKDSVVCSTKRASVKETEPSTLRRLELRESLVVLQVDLGGAAAILTGTTAVALRLGTSAIIRALEVSATLGTSLARNEIVGVLHSLEVEDHLGLLLLFLLLLALLLLVLVALSLRLTHATHHYDEVVLLHSLQLLALHGLHGARRLLAQQLAHLRLALRLVLLEGEHGLLLTPPTQQYGLRLSSHLLLSDGGLLHGLGLVGPTRHPFCTALTGDPWHPWDYPSFWDPIRSWGSHD